jgi:hypothetical protein
MEKSNEEGRKEVEKMSVRSMKKQNEVRIKKLKVNL